MRVFRALRVIAAVSVLSCCTAFCHDSTDAQHDDLELLKRTSRAFSGVAKKAMPAVVYIEVQQAGPAPSSQGQRPGTGENGHAGDRRRPYTQRRPNQSRHGSGFLVSPDGYILTNNHIVEGVERVTVRLHDGSVHPAAVTGGDPRSEVALLKIEGKELPHLELGSTDNLEVGEWVIAVGNPFGLRATLTVGVVSAKGRSNIGVAEYEDFIQTDAAINPGNSGGPLLNLDGQVVGMNTAIYSESGGHMGIGFAIPIDMAKIVMGQLKKSGKFIRGYLGIQLNRDDIDEDMAESFGLTNVTGALVADVLTDSPANEAGLKEGDVVLAMNGGRIPDNNFFRSQIALTEPGRKISLQVFRAGKTKEVTVTVGTFPGDIDLARRGAKLAGDLGLTLQELTPDIAVHLGFEPEEGVLVMTVRPGSIAASADIQPGNLIVSINRNPVGDIATFGQLLTKSASNGNALLRLRNIKFTWYVLVKLP